MNNDEWYTFADAGRLVGKSRAWLFSVKEKHPEYFDNVEIRRIGRYFTINQDGIDKILKQTKKAGDHLRAVTLNVVYKTKNRLCFCPFIF